ncbi:hypothetical protein AB4Y86_00115 [Arthrobacter sp. 2YAF22_2]|uniref:hypothetical protein n=1 Tax=Arthrobacter sp. 2YAF22_2 TaxID=3233029 RepID=UPI003F938613
MNQPDETAPILTTQDWETLQKSHADYQSSTSTAYDEVLNEVAERILDTGSIGKADIGALLFWKRLRANTPWVSDLMTLRDQQVRAVTKEAVSAVTNKSLLIPQAASAGRRALSDLPGFKTGDALASALLLAAAPERMAVYDRRARAGLKILNLPLSAAPGRYGRYMKLVEDLQSTAAVHGHTWTARDVDVALYWLGNPKRNPRT